MGVDRPERFRARHDRPESHECRDGEERPLLQQDPARRGRPARLLPPRTDPPQRVEIQDQQDDRPGHRDAFAQAGRDEQGERPPVSPTPPEWAGRVGRVDVGQGRQQAEKDAGQIRLARRPGDDLHPQRMHGKERRRQGAEQEEVGPVPDRRLAEAARNEFQRQGIQRHRDGRMEQQARQVVSPRLQAEQGILPLQQPPGQRLPDPQQGRFPGPGELRRSEAAETGVVEEVGLIVELVEPAVAEDRSARDDGRDRHGEGQPRGPDVRARPVEPVPERSRPGRLRATGSRRVDVGRMLWRPISSWMGRVRRTWVVAGFANRPRPGPKGNVLPTTTATPARPRADRTTIEVDGLNVDREDSSFGNRSELFWKEALAWRESASRRRVCPTCSPSA